MSESPQDWTHDRLLAAWTIAQRELDDARALLADVWVKIPIRWSKIDVGQIVVDDTARLWVVGDRHVRTDRQIDVTVSQVGATKLYVREVHADAVVNVLVPGAERDALLLLRAEFGAQLVEPERG